MHLRAPKISYFLGDMPPDLPTRPPLAACALHTFFLPTPLHHPGMWSIFANMVAMAFLKYHQSWVTK